MSPWTIYWLNQFDIIRLVLLGFAIPTTAASIFCLVSGYSNAQGRSLEDPRFIAAQTIRHLGFKLLTGAIILWVLLTFIPSSTVACQMHPECQFTANLAQPRT